MAVNFICKIAAQAGAGVMTTGRAMVKCFTRGGYNAIGYPEYPSLIRGGHNTVQVRISDKPIYGPLAHQNLVIALNKDAVFYHMNSMVKGGAIIYDQLIDISKFKVREDVRMLPLPLSKLTADAGGTEQMKNIATLGAALAIIDYPFDILEGILKDEFKRKGDAVIKMNVDAAKAGYEYIKKHLQENKVEFEKIKPLSHNRKVIITGNEAIALGAVKAGLKFYSAYPMTPASTILHHLIEVEKKYNIVVKQTEDEIAAINYAIGASFAGVRAMVGTSGGGFALMVEALGMAAISETPIVIALAQRIGPSTGMPTWTEQGDLRFALHASQGDFPRVILAPGDVDECFHMTVKAMNLADKYQIPVIIMSDKQLSESVYSIEKFDQAKVKIEHGKRAKDLPPLPPMARWTRYKITEDGVSERVFPGTPNGLHVATSYEHDERGFSSESFVMRTNQVDKRARKLKTLMHEIELPHVYGAKMNEAEVTFIGWGSIKLTALDLLAMLEAKGIKANYVHFSYIYPMDEEGIRKLLKPAKVKILVENNSTAQFGGILKQLTGIEMDFEMLKYDGRPFFPEQIIEELEKLKTASYKVEKTHNKSKRIVIVEKEDLEYYHPQKYGL